MSITADIGRTAVVPPSLGRAFINQHLALLRPKKVHPEYLSAFLASSAVGTGSAVASSGAADSAATGAVASAAGVTVDEDVNPDPDAEADAFEVALILSILLLIVEEMGGEEIGT